MIKKLTSIIFLIIGVLDFLLKDYYREKWIPPKIGLYLDVAGFIVVPVCVIILMCLYLISPGPIRSKLSSILERVNKGLKEIEHWLILVIAILIIVITIFLYIRTSSKIICVPFDRTKGALFNSWERNPQHNRHITVVGSEQETQMWTIDDKEGSAYFSYKTDSTKPIDDPKASSGGYMTFYEKPCDRLAYHELSFKCRVTDTIGNSTPDIGIRLAVDNLKASGDREVVTYEISSLLKQLRSITLDDSWQTFIIPISAFKQTRIEGLPFLGGINENTINKIVFFINAEITRDCSEGKLWFRDICFK